MDRGDLLRHFAPELLQALQCDGPLRGASRRLFARPFRHKRHTADVLVSHLQRPDGSGGAGAAVLRGSCEGGCSRRSAHLCQWSPRDRTGRRRPGPRPMAGPAGHAEDDKKRRDEIEMRNEADNSVYRSEKILKDNADKISGSDKGKIKEAGKEVK